MKVPISESGGGSMGTAGIASPAVIVFLVLLLGATVFLWRARYMRRRTAYWTIGILVLALIYVGASAYRGT